MLMKQYVSYYGLIIPTQARWIPMTSKADDYVEWQCALRASHAVALLRKALIAFSVHFKRN